MVQCQYYTDYMFTGPTGQRHALGLSAWHVGLQAGCQQYGPSQYLTGGDDFLHADANAGGAYARVSDADGTLYTFAGGPYSLANSIEDRNGNRATISTTGGSGGFTMTDSSGRQAVAVSSFGQSGGDTITVSGLTNSFHVYWGSVSYNYNPGWTKVYGGGHCPSFEADTGTHNVITSITLPNGQVCGFHYNTYGLLSEIDYPTGGWVKYTWGFNPSSEFVALYDSFGNPGACGYHYGTPAVLTRQVSFDGTNVALEQDLNSYSTNWTSGNNNSTWTTKQTAMAQTVAGAQSSQRMYTYNPVNVPFQPNDLWVPPGGKQPPTIALWTPVEGTVVYEDGSGSPMRTATEFWYDQFELACALDTHDGSGLSGVYYVYGPGAQVTDKQEYDYGQIGGTGQCSQSQHTAPGTPMRETAVTYDTSLTNSAGFHIYDRPLTIAVSGASSAETDFSYDTNGNALSKTRMCLGSCQGGAGNAMTQYGYDGYGNVTSMKDPKLYTTTYTYDSTYHPYLTQITYAQTSNGVSHIVSFAYDLSSGELTSSTDQNNPPNTTGYQYSDSLNRLTEIDYPDGGKTTYSYNDTPLSPSVTTGKLLSPGVGANPSTATMDGLGHVVSVIGENGAETDMTYDGNGQLHTQTNPGDPAHYMTYNHDALERLSSTVYQDGNTASVSYSGNCATTTDPANKTNETCTDALGRLTSDTDGLSNTANYAYDALDNLTSVNQGGQSRSFGYDSLSEMYQATNPESGTTSYTYDADGNVLTRTDARGITTTYTYDADNRLTSKSYSNDPSGTPTATYVYDETSVTIGNWTSPALGNPVGRLTHTTTVSGGTIQTATVDSYDAMGDIASFWQCASYNCGSANIWNSSYGYDPAGDLTSYTSYAGFTVSQAFNGAQQVTSASSNWSGTYLTLATLSYNPTGAIDSMCGGQGCAQSQEIREYNNRLQPVVFQVGNSNSPAADDCLVGVEGSARYEGTASR